MKTGIPYNRDIILDAMERHHGNLEHVAQEIGITNRHLHHVIQDDIAIKQRLADIREQWREKTVRRSIGVLNYLMQDPDQDRKSAFNAAKYYLDKLGEHRGYFPSTSDDSLIRLGETFDEIDKKIEEEDEENEAK